MVTHEVTTPGYGEIVLTADIISLPPLRCGTCVNCGAQGSPMATIGVKHRHTLSAPNHLAVATVTSRRPPRCQRPGHASAVVTLVVYAHVVPGSQRDAADRFAALVGGAQG
jgi:hypothetical protein